MFIREKKTFAIEYEGKVIGSVGIELYNEDQMPELADKAGREIGFVLSKDHWRRGLMPEAVRGVIKWLFDEGGLYFIVCGHSPKICVQRECRKNAGSDHTKKELSLLSAVSRGKPAELYYIVSAQ